VVHWLLSLQRQPKVITLCVYKLAMDLRGYADTFWYPFMLWWSLEWIHNCIVLHPPNYFNTLWLHQQQAVWCIKLN
jgi:hypothetical protein